MLPLEASKCYTEHCALGVPGDAEQCALWVCPGCALGVSWVCIGCALGVPGNTEQCALGVTWVCPGCACRSPLRPPRSSSRTSSASWGRSRTWCTRTRPTPSSACWCSRTGPDFRLSEAEVASLCAAPAGGALQCAQDARVPGAVPAACCHGPDTPSVHCLCPSGTGA